MDDRKSCLGREGGGMERPATVHFVKLDLVREGGGPFVLHEIVYSSSADMVISNPDMVLDSVPKLCGIGRPPDVCMVV